MHIGAITLHPHRTCSAGHKLVPGTTEPHVQSSLLTLQSQALLFGAASGAQDNEIRGRVGLADMLDMDMDMPWHGGSC